MSLATDKHQQSSLRAEMPGFNAMQFGSALRTRRRTLGLTQHHVAASINVSRRVIGELEGGRGTVRLEIALETARAVGLNVFLHERGR